ncbi:uncharacterized protein PV09_03675 [Verruconis gallopava]|uniref:Transcription factor 25 n=1 Tax=Verruconis gallopava TaxID=253628 RepID=A0A0D2B1C1_9PEZI|nr:uncharacterized protein PV09_03675 [Verruconis gallopava]KIW05119.1 hypothetical protein PV09_03675 [Verruconis gallopava]
MSSRALRRLQKQKEEQKAQQVTSESDSDAGQAPTRSHQSAFTLLNDIGENSNDDDGLFENEEGSFPSAVTPERTAEPKSLQPRNTGSKKKKNKKNKAKATKVTSSKNSAKEDDIDAVLASLAQQSQNEAATPGEPISNQLNYENLLAVDSQNLHAINEMRRLFGRDVIGDQPRQQNPAARRVRGQRAQHSTGGFPAVTLKRNLFVQGKEEWPRATTGGLGMEVVHKDPESGVTEYRFVHSAAYQETQKQYEIAVASMDPQRLIMLLEHNPYHIATLLQVSEIMKHDRMHTEAGDMLERALFAFGRTVHSTFTAAVAAGKARLSFDRPENREFYLACWRYIQDLSMRSTWRTVYEWAKMLLCLGLPDDPYFITLVIDQYALRANQAQHYLELYRTGIFGQPSDYQWSLPYSVALCLSRLSRHEEAKAALLEAMERDRYTAHQLFKMVEIEPIPPSLWPHHEAPDPNTKLYSTMYTMRAKDLWNNTEAKSLLQNVAKELSKVGASTMVTQAPSLTVEAARHVYLTENDAFMRLLADSETYDDIHLDPGDRPTQDPFPPLSEIRTYDPRPIGGRPGMLGPGIEALGRLPDGEIRRALQALAGMRILEQGVNEESWDEDEGREASDEDEDLAAGTAR